MHQQSQHPTLQLPRIFFGSFGVHTTHTGVALPIAEGVYVLDPVVCLHPVACRCLPVLLA